MKTLTSHISRPLPAIFVILLLAFAAAAQTRDIQVTGAETPSAVVGSNILNIGGLQQPANFTIASKVPGNMFNAKSLFNIEPSLVLPFGSYFAGIDAGRSTTGNANSFVGFNAGYSNAGGTANSFVGYFAGRSNTNGINNAFVGAAAGYNNQVGGANSSFGAYAGYSNKTGNHNSFIGHGAGYYNTGSNNAFLGSSAGYGSSTPGVDMNGSDNAFVGSNAGVSIERGSNNSFIGSNAGSLTKDGKNNSFVGSRAGYGNKTGSNNTVIGASADVGSDKLTYATAIGSGAVVSNNNTIVLGRNLDITGIIKGPDTVLMPGGLQLNKLGTAGTIPLCRNTNNEISTCSSNLQAQIDAQQQQLKDQQVVIEGLKKLLCAQNPAAEVCKP